MNLALKSPLLWRNKFLPYIEARYVADGRKVCYGKHFHDNFSIGAIVKGSSSYFNNNQYHAISEGTVVLINPDTVHACNPTNGQAWSYLMFYIDTPWLIQLQQQMCLNTQGAFYKFTSAHTNNSKLFYGLLALYQTLTNPSSVLEKEIGAVDFFSQLHQLEFIIPNTDMALPKLTEVAEYIAEYCREDLHLADLCEVAKLSPYYLIHSFKKHYGISPYAYLINKRIQQAQTLLKQGCSIAEVALNTGFADQAHFQRTFKRLLAITPKQYQAL